MTELPLSGLGNDQARWSQAIFRSILDALANPARPTAVDTPGQLSSWPIHPSAVAGLLTLLDADTTVWIDQRLPPQVGASLRFHTGATVALDVEDADFALVADAAELLPLQRFKQGTVEFPDASATVFVLVDSFVDGSAGVASGPGIPTRRVLSPAGFLPAHWSELQAQAKRSPLGADLLLCSPNEFVGLPRSTRVLAGTES
jgi:alpha-D-ribose 1-methylphosphonate 5-triphosphate synthase subunit PhnH